MEQLVAHLHVDFEIGEKEATFTNDFTLVGAPHLKPKECRLYKLLTSLLP